MFIFLSLFVFTQSSFYYYLYFSIPTITNLDITEVFLPISSKPPCANMCEYKQHALPFSDDFVIPVSTRYIVIVYRVISQYSCVLFILSPKKHTCFIARKREGG